MKGRCKCRERSRDLEVIETVPYAPKVQGLLEGRKNPSAFYLIFLMEDKIMAKSKDVKKDEKKKPAKSAKEKKEAKKLKKAGKE